MKILHCIHSVNPAGGGPVDFLRQLAFLQHELGYCMEVVCLDSTDDMHLGSLPCRVYALGPSLRGYGYNNRFVPWLTKHASEYDAVLVQGIWQFVSFGTWLAAHEVKFPYFVYTHGMLDPWFNKAYPRKRLKKMMYWPWAEYRVLRDARAVLFTCEEERRLARESFRPYRCKEIVVGHGTTAPSGDQHEQRELFFEAFPHLRGKRLFLFLGRIHEKKGIDLLISAFSRLGSGAGDVQLVVAGPGESSYQRELDEVICGLPADVRERITFTGMLLGDLKWGALSAADAFVLPSHQENFGQAVTEALSCGTPVLITDKVNIWQEIADCGAGLVDRDDAEGVVRLLGRWLDFSEQEQQATREKAQQCFDEHFDLRKTAANLLSVLRRESAS